MHYNVFMIISFYYPRAFSKNCSYFLPFSSRKNPVIIIQKGVKKYVTKSCSSASPPTPSSALLGAVKATPTNSWRWSAPDEDASQSWQALTAWLAFGGFGNGFAKADSDGEKMPHCLHEFNLHRPAGFISNIYIICSIVVQSVDFLETCWKYLIRSAFPLSPFLLRPPDPRPLVPLGRWTCL